LALSGGALVSADLVIAATGSVAPAWLAQSGLGCTDQGFVAVGADLRSRSHPAIFAAGDIIERTDRRLPRSGVHAVKAGPVLAANLRAAFSGAPLRTYHPSAHTLYLLSQGNRRAIASWGGLATSGRLTWWLKDQIDRRFIARYTR
jgi:NADH dehydrogenase FAD-containing subunit